MSFTLDGDTMPMPPTEGGIEVTNQFFGKTQRMKNAAFRQDLVARKSRITINWKQLTADELYDVESVLYYADWSNGASLVLPTGATFTVLPDGDFSKPQTYDKDGTPYFDLTVQFQET